MRWEKKGLVYAPSGELWWARTHAHVPTVDPTVTDVIRVYVTGLDENNYGRIGYVDLDLDDPRRIVSMSKEPVLDLGESGSFDDCGVVACSLVPFEGSTYMYYAGFQRTTRAPYSLFTGLAVAALGDTHFVRHSEVPVLDRIAGEPFVRSAPDVVCDDGILKMWYVSSATWSRTDDRLHYRCTIRYAVSENGVTWRPHDRPCIEPEGDDEYAVTRPWVLREGNMYRMWYSRRGFREEYAIGYAESTDGIVWRRRDDLAGIGRSASGWDSEMVCYACVTDRCGRRLMFYNGNRRGASGFGYAVQGS